MNKQRGTITVAVGEQERPLRFSFDALANLEERLGVKNAVELMGLDFDSFRVLREFFVVGFMDADPNLKEDEARILFRNIDMDLVTLANKLVEGMRAAGLIPEEGEEVDPPQMEEVTPSTGETPREPHTVMD